MPFAGIATFIVARKGAPGPDLPPVLCDRCSQSCRVSPLSPTFRALHSAQIAAYIAFFAGPSLH